MGMAQVLNNNQPGYTPFSLNISCQNMQQEGIADRAVEMFLSSNNLLASDASVLTNANAGGAQGVGLRLVKRDMPSSPVVLSPSNVDRGSAHHCFMSPPAAYRQSLHHRHGRLLLPLSARRRDAGGNQHLGHVEHHLSLRGLGEPVRNLFRSPVFRRVFENMRAGALLAQNIVWVAQRAVGERQAAAADAAVEMVAQHR